MREPTTRRLPVLTVCCFCCFHNHACRCLHNSHQKKQATPGKINMETPKMEVWKMMFLFNLVIFRFHEKIFRSVVLEKGEILNTTEVTASAQRPEDRSRVVTFINFISSTKNRIKVNTKHMVSFPYYSHIFRDPKMGVVWVP